MVKKDTMVLNHIDYLIKNRSKMKVDEENQPDFFLWSNSKHLEY